MKKWDKERFHFLKPAFECVLPNWQRDGRITPVPVMAGEDPRRDAVRSETEIAGQFPSRASRWGKPSGYNTARTLFIQASIGTTSVL